MTGASSSNPPPQPPQVAPAESSPLAPGFRFHPTDEELVSYYLKRKVSGRPLRVDAIAEVELYKAEPWDLPSLSRLRSRDMEWYFFSPLDRKYANRSRTNRATAQGYWKTTGKDRPVRHGPRIVGMKKTLVFHAGRAPRGERTNWVMHEYRLEDQDLAIPQDSYVVCRIFQKSGTGPQNGAQYGALLDEEEWDEETDNMPLAIVDSGGANASNVVLPPRPSDVAVVCHGEYLQLSDLVENQDRGGALLITNSDGQNSGIGSEDDHIFLVEGISQDQIFADVMDTSEQPDNGALLVTDYDGQNGGSVPKDEPIFLVEDISQDQIFTDVLDPFRLQDCQSVYVNTRGKAAMLNLCPAPCQNDEYYSEMNDIDNSSNEESVGRFLGECYDQTSLNQGDESSNLPEMNGVEKFFDSINVSTDSSAMFQMCPFLDDFFLEPNVVKPIVEPNDVKPIVEPNDVKPIVGDYPSNQTPEDNLVFFDASSDDLLLGIDNFEQMNDPYYPIAGSYELNTVDDIAAYVGKTADNLNYPSLNDSSEKFSLPSTESIVSPEVGSSFEEPTKPSDLNVGASSVRLPGSDDWPNIINENVTMLSDSKGSKGCDRTLTKRLANMLGSISAPPALAADSPTLLGKPLGQIISATNPSSSINVSAKMIQIHGFKVMGTVKHQPFHKDGGIGFLFSCGVASSKLDVGNFTKVQDWSVSVALRGGICLFFLSAMFLTLCVKVGMHGYCR